MDEELARETHKIIYNIMNEYKCYVQHPRQAYKGPIFIERNENLDYLLPIAVKIENRNDTLVWFESILHAVMDGWRAL